MSRWTVLAHEPGTRVDILTMLPKIAIVYLPPIPNGLGINLGTAMCRDR